MTSLGKHYGDPPPRKNVKVQPVKLRIPLKKCPGILGGGSPEAETPRLSRKVFGDFRIQLSFVIVWIWVILSPSCSASRWTNNASHTKHFQTNLGEGDFPSSQGLMNGITTRVVSAQLIYSIWHDMFVKWDIFLKRFHVMCQPQNLQTPRALCWRRREHICLGHSNSKIVRKPPSKWALHQLHLKFPKEPISNSESCFLIEAGPGFGVPCWCFSDSLLISYVGSKFVSSGISLPQELWVNPTWKSSFPWHFLTNKYLPGSSMKEAASILRIVDFRLRYHFYAFRKAFRYSVTAPSFETSSHSTPINLRDVWSHNSGNNLQGNCHLFFMESFPFLHAVS